MLLWQHVTDDLEGSESKLKSEVQKLRSGLEELDRERDEMVLSAKERTEELSSLHAKIDQLVRCQCTCNIRTLHKMNCTYVCSLRGYYVEWSCVSRCKREMMFLEERHIYRNL